MSYCLKKLPAVDFERNFIKYFANCTAQNSSFLAVADAGWEQRGLNNEDLGLELEINGDLRINNRGQMKKSGSPWGCSPGSPPLDPPLVVTIKLINHNYIYLFLKQCL